MHYEILKTWIFLAKNWFRAFQEPLGLIETGGDNGNFKRVGVRLCVQRSGMILAIQFLKPFIS